MKITIWQQFSSNHSSYFWIAGTFDSVEATDAAYWTLRNILLQIDQWHRDNPDESREARMARNAPPVPIEQEISEQYEIEWPMTLDWMNVAFYLPRERLEESLDWTLRSVGQTIVMINPNETWNGVQPFDGLMIRLGATAVVGYDFLQREAGTAQDVRLDLYCTAPDEQSAVTIEREVRQYLSGKLASIVNPPPWQHDESNFSMAYDNTDLLRRKHVERVQRIWQRRSERGSEFYRNLVREQRLALERGSVRREGLQLIFEDIWFHNIVLGLSAMIAYLVVQGCTDITPQFLAVPRK